MRMVAHGVAPARRAPMLPSERAPAAPSGPPRLYAVVAVRDANGIPTDIALPGPLVGERVRLFVGLDCAGWVHSSGVVQSPERDEDLLGRIQPGTRIVAATDSAGRVLALSTVGARLPAASQKRAAAPVRTRAVDPMLPEYWSRNGASTGKGELFFSGGNGRILDVR